MQPEQTVPCGTEPQKVNVIVHLISGVSFLAKDLPSETYDQLMLCLRDPAITELTLNQQWFNKSSIATAYIEPKPEEVPASEEKTQSCCM